MENKLRIQDDLYRYVNHDWMEKAVIPDDKPLVGGFAELDDGVEKILIKDLNDMSEGKLEIKGEHLQKVVDLYNMAKNTKKRNKEGIKPIIKKLEKIEKITNIKQFNKKLSELILEDFPLPFRMEVEVNMKDAQHYCVMIAGPSCILPDTTYYKENMAQQRDALLGIWSQMAKSLLAHTSLNEEKQNKYIQDTLAFDAIISTLVKSSEEWSDYTKMFNPMKINKVASALKPINLKKVTTTLYGEMPQEIIVAEPRFLKGFKTLFNEETFEQYIHWAYTKILVDASGLLSEELREIGSTYSRTLTGVAVLPSIEKQAYRLVGRIFGEPLGLYYGKTYFGEEAKKDIIEIVKQIIETYKKRVNESEFLSQQTKEKAIVKLSKMGVKMGYPDKCRELYDFLNVNPKDSLYIALDKIGIEERKYKNSKLYKNVDKTLWAMPANMVNACYSPTENDITFPAAILQAPFYSVKQSRSSNLGGIGAVIGHEISHAFDTNGAKCDENGNLNNWWTKEDFKKFSKKTDAMAKQFDGIELEQGKVNGKFIVSENIADNGGMAVTLDIMSKLEGANYEEYFYNWAKVWCLKARPEYLKLILSIDVHAPAELRANMQPRNFEEWYNTFNVKKTDKMYLAPNKRVIIW